MMPTYAIVSLRRYEPDQVVRVLSQSNLLDTPNEHVQIYDYFMMIILFVTVCFPIFAL